MAGDAPALEELKEHTRGKLSLPDPLSGQALQKPFALLLHDEAASHVPLDLPAEPALIISAARPERRAPGAVSQKASAFAIGAVESGARQASSAFNVPAVEWTSDRSLASLLNEHNLEQLVVPYLPTGWTRDALMPELAPMMDNNRAHVALADLSLATWPHAKAGFFGVKKKINPILRQIAITGSDLAAAS